MISKDSWYFIPKGLLTVAYWERYINKKSKRKKMTVLTSWMYVKVLFTFRSKPVLITINSFSHKKKKKRLKHLLLQWNLACLVFIKTSKSPMWVLSFLDFKPRKLKTNVDVFMYYLSLTKSTRLIQYPGLLTLLKWKQKWQILRFLE